MFATYSLYVDRDMCARDEDTICVRLLLGAWPKTSRLPINSTLEWERVSVHHHAYLSDTTCRVHVTGVLQVALFVPLQDRAHSTTRALSHKLTNFVKLRL